MSKGAAGLPVPKRDTRSMRQETSLTCVLAAIAVAGLASAFMVAHALAARARVSIEIASTRTQCYQGQPRRELLSMPLFSGIGMKVLQDRPLDLSLHPVEVPEQLEVVPQDATCEAVPSAE